MKIMANINSNQVHDQCACACCDISKIVNLNENFRMTACSNATNGCKTIRKFFKNGYKVRTQMPSKHLYEEEPFDEIVSRQNLVQALTHTLLIGHPKDAKLVYKFILARYRSCVSIHERYYTGGFYVSDNYSLALLRFKTNKRLSCYFIDMTTGEMKHTDIGIELIDKDLCSIYLYNGSLWIVQNSEIGVINVALVRLKDNPVRTIARAFGTMDYWNPNDGRVIFTDSDICHGFLRVTLDSKKTKIVRKQVSTLKNSFITPVGNRQLILTNDFQLGQIYFEFYHKEEKLRVLRTVIWHAKFDRRCYTSCMSEITNLAVIRINRTDILVIDVLTCRVLTRLCVNLEYDLLKELHFMFSPNGKKVLVLGSRLNSDNEYFWTQHLVCGMRSLKESAARVVLSTFSTDDIRRFNVPKTLRYELTFEK